MPFVSLSPCADPGVLPMSWLDASDERIAREAALHHGACDAGDLDPCELTWTLVVDLPLALLIGCMGDGSGWREWLDDEIAMHEEDGTGYDDVYRSLMNEPLDNPIVVTVEPGRVQIWDGWHRTATRIVGGAVTIPAIVGTSEGQTLDDLVAVRLALVA